MSVSLPESRGAAQPKAEPPSHGGDHAAPQQAPWREASPEPKRSAGLRGAPSESGEGGGVPDAGVDATQFTLMVSVFVVAACGLLYELIAGALASYVLGDSVLQFSTIIGTYLFAMGVGSWLSRYLEGPLAAHFLRVELLVALVGGCMPALLFLINVHAAASFRFALYGLVMVVGILAGLEIPLVMRILRRQVQLKNLVSQVLTFDYLGALAVSLAFPLLLVPHLGLVRTGFLFGLINALVAFWIWALFRHQLRRAMWHAVACAAVVVLLALGMWQAERITELAEDRFYQNDIVWSHSSPYQRIVLTQGRQGARLYLNGNLQFAERDEYRYHEALVHPAMAAHGAPQRVAVLGGGDGMAVREVLKHRSVKSVTLVELDPAMTQAFRTQPMLQRLNADALNDPRVTVVNADAFQWLQQGEDTFDVIVVDFPDPTNFAIGKLFTNSFYALLDRRLAASGYAVVQTTSPLVARESFWTVVKTMESVGLSTTPYHAHVPSFGEWGFVIVSRRPWRMPEQLPADLRFLNLNGLPLLMDFPPDMARVPAEVNRLSNQVLVRTYAREWGKVME